MLAVGALGGLHLEDEVLKFGPFRWTGIVMERDAREWSITPYLLGKIHGTQLRVYRNVFRISSVRKFRNGVKVGTHEGWFEQGGPRFHYEYEGGVHHGNVIEWHPNGRVYRWTQYAQGVEVGQKIWRDTGQIYANYVRDGNRLRGLQGGKLCVTTKP